MNKKSAIICTECEKKIKAQHSPFRDFLFRHLKSDVTDTASTSLFSILRKLIVSHLYGTILTVSIIATVTVSAFSTTPYVEPSSISTINITSESPVEEPVATVDEETETEEDTQTDNFIGNYTPDWVDGSYVNIKKSGTEFYADIFLVRALDVENAFCDIVDEKTMTFSSADWGDGILGTIEWSEDYKTITIRSDNPNWVYMASSEVTCHKD